MLGLGIQLGKGGSTKSPYGDEIIVNGDFSTSTWWVAIGTPGVIEDGVLKVVSSGETAGMRKSVLEAGKTYHYELDVVVNSGVCKMLMGSTSVKESYSSSGHYSGNVTQAGDLYVYLIRDTACDVEFDNFSVKEVL